MTRTIAIIFLVLSIFTLGLVECISVNKIINGLEETVTYMQENIEQYKDDVSPLYDTIDKQRDIWEKNEVWLTLVFNHKDLSNICDNLSRLCSLIELNNFEDSYVELNLLYENVFELKDMMGFNYQNIL